jgi:CRP-like cAMP-binding protein
VAIDTSAIVNLLKRVPLFEACTETDLNEIAEVARPVSFPAGAQLIVEGDRSHREFFVIITGRVAVTVKGNMVNELADGDFFGEIQLLVDTPRLASVRAIGPVRALVITEETFRGVIHKVPSIGVEIAYYLAGIVAYYARQYGNQRSGV